MMSWNQADAKRVYGLICGNAVVERKMAVVLIHNDDDDREHDRDADDDDFGGAMFFKTMNTHFLPVCATHTTHTFKPMARLELN